MAKNSFIVQSAWVVVFIAVCGAVYMRAAGKKDEVVAKLDAHLSQLKIEKQALLKEKEDLMLQVNSQSDPAWIQLTLMKGLGLVPEGQLKVYFYPDEIR